MEFPIVKIINSTSSGKRIRGPQCFVGDLEIPKVISADFHVSVDEVPTFNFKTIGIPDMEMLGRAVIAFHPDTVMDAMKVLQYELMHDRTLYDGFLSSIESALNEAKPYTKEHDLAVAILNRLIGEE